MRESTPGIPKQPDPDIPMPVDRVTDTIIESSEPQESDEALVRRVADITERERGERLTEIQKAVNRGEMDEEEALKQLATLGKGERSAQGKVQRNDQVVGPDQRGTGQYEDHPEGKPIGAGKGAGGSGEQRVHDIKNHPAGVSPATLPRSKTVAMPLEDRRNILGMKYYGAIALRNLYRFFAANKLFTAKVNPAENVPGIPPPESNPAQKSDQSVDKSTTSETTQQSAPEAKAEDPAEQAVKEIRSLGVEINGNEEPDELREKINGVITEHNKQEGNANIPLWGNDQETFIKLLASIDFIKKQNAVVATQPTGQQKT